MTSTMTPSGMFGWRGQEGSVSDRDSGLVYMQSRHYDPTLGRFIQANALVLSGLSTQALNQYTYCENDPANASDPSGFSRGGGGAGAVAVGALEGGLGVLYAALYSFALTAAMMGAYLTLAEVVAAVAFANACFMWDPFDRWFDIANFGEEPPNKLPDPRDPYIWSLYMSWASGTAGIGMPRV